MKNWFRKTSKKNKSTPRLRRLLPQWSQEFSGEKSYYALCEEGYQQNVIVYRAVNLIAKNLAGVPWLLQEDSAHSQESYAACWPLMHNPNPLQARADFMESLFSSLLDGLEP